MHTTKPELYKGCLIASIAHAIMTNVYPDLSYEQSWDGVNYSIQNSAGLRGTITFDVDFCVGAIRNDALSFSGDRQQIQNMIQGFPLRIIDKAYEETLQYLLVEKDGMLVPCATSMFWADTKTIYYPQKAFMNVMDDFSLFRRMILPEENAIHEWREYYDMDSNAVNLLRYLYKEKMKKFTEKIELSNQQKKMLPGNEINVECIESLNELNIYC